MLGYVVSAVAAYLLGSLSFGIIFSKLKYKKDIRDYGSNNAGMTNMLRTFGKGAAALVFLFDTLKGAAAVLIAKYLLHFAGDPTVCAYTAMVFVVLGHLFPLYFGFRGGKGVATSLGAATALAPITFPLVMIPFLLILLIGRMVSLASVICGILLPIVTFCIYHFKGEPTLVPTVATAILALLVLFMHRTNLVRIAHGEERKIGADKVNVEAESKDNQDNQAK